jgi:hypothetical protein
MILEPRASRSPRHPASVPAATARLPVVTPSYQTATQSRLTSKTPVRRRRTRGAAVTHSIIVCDGALPGLARLGGYVPPLLARRHTRGIPRPARSSRGGRDGRRIFDRVRASAWAAAEKPKRYSGSGPWLPAVAKRRAAERSTSDVRVSVPSPSVRVSAIGRSRLWQSMRPRSRSWGRGRWTRAGGSGRVSPPLRQSAGAALRTVFAPRATGAAPRYRPVRRRTGCGPRRERPRRPAPPRTPARRRDHRAVRPQPHSRR